MSDLKQVKDGNSLATQEKDVRAFAENKGLTLVRIFIEEGQTAKTDDRKQLQLMLEYCQQNVGKIQVLIIPKIDRFARQTFDYYLLKKRIKGWGVRLESVGERLEDTPVGRFTESVLASVAQFDNEIRAERSKGGMIQAVTEGRWVCKAPRGYRNIKYDGRCTIAPDPTDAPLITGAFERLASGRYRPKEVREWLASQGLRLGRTQFYRLIRNRAYLGLIETFGLSVPAKPPFMPLVSPEVFYLAQDGVEARKTMQPMQRDNEEFPLRGTLRCQCGELLIANWSQGRSARYPYYRCRSCKRTNFPRELVTLHFTQELASFQPNSESWDRCTNWIHREWKTEQQTKKERLCAAKMEVTKVEDRLRLAIQKNLQGVLPDHLVKEHIQECEKAIALLQARQKRIEMSVDVDEMLHFAEHFFVNLPSLWQGFALSDKKRLQHYFYPNGLEYNRIQGCRTVERGPLTGLKAFLRGEDSGKVDLQHNSANRAKDFLPIFMQLYAQFDSSSTTNEDIKNS